MSPKKSSNISSSTQKDATKKTASGRNFLAAFLVGVVNVAIIAWGVWALWPYDRTNIQIAQQTFTVRLATTASERTHGLSGVRSLTEHEGMLFVFDHDEKWGFWMKDMHVSLDILWLDSHKKVVHIEKNIPPDSYPATFTPSTPARYVVELPAGSVQELGITIGMPANFSLPPGRGGMIKL